MIARRPLPPRLAYRSGLFVFVSDRLVGGGSISDESPRHPDEMTTESDRNRAEALNANLIEKAL